eukprot:283882-Chlamydomonas_euryale.AAC.5
MRPASPPARPTPTPQAFQQSIGPCFATFPSAGPAPQVFQQSSGFCFVTFSEHAAPVTAVAFLPSGHALVSASLDGTVRAYDLVRYRNFRTMASPTPVQFGCVAVEPGGEIVAAGTVDSFQ